MTCHVIMLYKMANKSEPLLSGTFSLYPRTQSCFEVTVTKKGITYKNTDTNTEDYVHFGDVIGCRCRKSKFTSESSGYLTLYVYPIRKVGIKSKLTRLRTDLTFGYNKHSTFNDNFNLCKKWRNVITHLIRGEDVNPNAIDVCPLPTRRHLLILINPHSGPGKAKQIFDNHVAPMLLEADISTSVLVTEYAGHATEVMKKLDLNKFDGVVIVSGDGLLYEAINGLMMRPDWEAAIKYPLGILPGGSGNALSLSINYTAGEPLNTNDILHSTFVLIKHKVIPMDLVLIQTPTFNIYSFLSVTWGLIADIDFESEKLRSIGAARFTVYTVIRLLKLRSYNGELCFLPAGKYIPKSKEVGAQLTRSVSYSRAGQREVANSISGEGFNTRYLPTHRQFSENDDRLRSMSMPTSLQLSTSGSVSDFDTAQKEENLADILANSRLNSTRTSSQDEHSDIELSGGDETHETIDLNHRNGKVANSNTEITYGNGDISHDTENVCHENGDETEHLNRQNSMDDKSLPKVPHPLLPPLGKELPSNWVKIKGDFITVMALYQPYLGPDNLGAPESRLNDGYIHLQFVRSGIPTSALINILLSFGDGDHINSPYIETVKVLAFRLLPDLGSGNIMVDGERVELSPIQGQILPGMARIMAIQ